MGASPLSRAKPWRLWAQPRHRHYYPTCQDRRAPLRRWSQPSPLPLRRPLCHTRRLGGNSLPRRQLTACSQSLHCRPQVLLPHQCPASEGPMVLMRLGLFQAETLSRLLLRKLLLQRRLAGYLPRILLSLRDSKCHSFSSKFLLQSCKSLVRNIKQVNCDRRYC